MITRHRRLGCERRVVKTTWKADSTQSAHTCVVQSSENGHKRSTSQLTGLPAVGHVGQQPQLALGLHRPPVEDDGAEVAVGVAEGSEICCLARVLMVAQGVIATTTTTPTYL